MMIRDATVAIPPSHRPPRGKTPLFDLPHIEELQESIKEYFDFAALHHHAPTLPGLAIAIGTTREILLNSLYDPQYRPIIQRAMTMLEEYNLQYLYHGKNPTAVQFIMKNHFNYQDRQDVQLTRPPTLSDTISSIEESNQLLLEQNEVTRQAMAAKKPLLHKG